MSEYEYMNTETGEILSYKDARKQFVEDYDGGDPTNPLTFDEYYEPLQQGGMKSAGSMAGTFRSTICKKNGWRAIH